MELLDEPTKLTRLLQRGVCVGLHVILWTKISDPGVRLEDALSRREGRGKSVGASETRAGSG